MRILLLLGLILTPFSTGSDGGAGAGGLPVFSFGIPFLALALALSFTIPSFNAFTFPKAVMPAVMAAALVVLTMAVFTFVAPHPDKSAMRLLPNLIGFLLAFRMLIVYINDKDRMLRFILQGLAFSGAAMSLYYIVHVAIAIAVYGPDVMIERYTGGRAALPWGASNIISAALLYPHIACYVLRWRYKYRWSGLILSLIAFTVVLTMSRTGIVVHGLLMIFGALFSRNYRYLVYGALAAIAFFRIYQIVAPDAMDIMLSTRFSSDFGGEDISNGRLDSFTVKSAYIMSNIMEPIGYYGSLFVFQLTSHNFFLTILLEQGIAGFIAFLAFSASALYAVFYKWKLNSVEAGCRRILVTGSLLAFCNLLVEDANFSQPYIIYFWMFFFVVMMFSMKINEHHTVSKPIASGRIAHA